MDAAWQQHGRGTSLHPRQAQPSADGTDRVPAGLPGLSPQRARLGTARLDCQPGPELFIRTVYQVSSSVPSPLISRHRLKSTSSSTMQGGGAGRAEWRRKVASRIYCRQREVRMFYNLAQVFRGEKAHAHGTQPNISHQVSYMLFTIRLYFGIPTLWDMMMAWGSCYNYLQRRDVYNLKCHSRLEHLLYFIPSV